METEDLCETEEYCALCWSNCGKKAGNGRQDDVVAAAVLVGGRRECVCAAAVIRVEVEAALDVGAFAVHMLAVVHADSDVAAKV